jgi:GNAT superfamily N-acetyltransferase
MSITYRKGTLEDNYTTFTIFQEAMLDFSARAGVLAITGGQSPEKMAKSWERRVSLWDHLANTCDQFWIAEENGKPVGYARSIRRGDVRELTEFFVLPQSQTAGVGRELLARVFPRHDVQHRVIVATSDFRALARYLKSGVYPYVTEMYVDRVPEPVQLDSDLEFTRMNSLEGALQETGKIDEAILGHRRDVDHTWLMQERTGYFYRRNREIVGYGYIHRDFYGPFAALDDHDFPAILAHAETQACELSSELIGFELPFVNRVATDYLMQRGYRLEGFFGSIMADQPFGKFENYLLTSPPYFL